MHICTRARARIDACRGGCANAHSDVKPAAERWLKIKNRLVEFKRLLPAVLPAGPWIPDCPGLWGQKDEAQGSEPWKDTGKG